MTQKRGIMKESKSVHVKPWLILLLFSLYCGMPSHAKTTQDDFFKRGLPERQVVVTYFHPAHQCRTCRKMETAIEKIIRNQFPKELKEGVLVYQSIDVGKKQNKHFVADYSLLTSSVIVSLVVHGEEKEWNHLEDVWKQIRKKEMFPQYIKDEIGAYLDQTDTQSPEE